VRIYIDESGNFIAGSASTRVCCEAALIVPEDVAGELLGEFVELRRTWTTEPEVKGSALTDQQAIAALTILGKYDVIVEAAAFDAAMHSLAGVRRFQNAAGEGIISGLTPQHNANAHQWAHRLRAEWLELSPQLAMQMYTLILTIEEIIQTAPNYYAQRTPAELARFDWNLDPKDVTPTPFEQVWRQIVCPILQTRSLQRPGARVSEFDYSAFDRFMMPIPDYLTPHLGSRRGNRGTGLNLGMLMGESVAFPDSRDEPGLQLADILASVIAKAMNGKLPPTVWRLLGPLMVEKPAGESLVRLVAFGHGQPVRANQYHAYVLTALRHRAKSMFPASDPGGQVSES
jgi:hypothetical protein